MKRRTLLISVLIAIFSFSTAQIFAQNALDFDGVDDFISIPNASFSVVGGPGISISCWVFPENSNAGWPNMDGFVGFRNNLDADFYLIQTTQFNVEARFRNSAGVGFDINYNSLLLNSWNHFTLTYDGAMLRLYHFSNAVDSIAANGTITNISESFFFGDLYFGPNDEFFLDGQLDEVGIWDRALSGAEVACLYDSGPDLADPNIKHYFDFDQGVAGGNNITVNALEDVLTNTSGSLIGFALNGATSNWVNGTFLEITNLEQEICDGETFDFNGQILTSAGTYFTTYSLSNGCDSSVVLNLTLFTTDVGVTQNGLELMANATGATYQWIDCSDDSPIAGATMQSYTATANGDYAVIVTENACSDTSDCFTVSSIGIEEVAWLAAVRLHPNPVHDRLIISFPSRSERVELELINLAGQVLIQRELGGIQEEIDLSGIEAGAYLMKISVGNYSQEVRKIIKE